MSLFAFNPALLWGSLLVASPIIIHLLNKRKFKIIDWAAMDFLLDAQKRNRRRINLEHLLLLLLRCLAILLITFLVARPYLNPSGLLALVAPAARFERIVVLDDSPSMGARAGSQTVFDEAKRHLKAFVRELARERPNDSLTLLTTSRPEQPHLSGQYLAGDRVESVARRIQSLQLSALPARFERTLLAVERLVAAAKSNVTVHLISDFRQRDWLTGKPAPERGLPGQLKRLAEKVQDCVLADFGGGPGANLALTGITLINKTLVAGVPAHFRAEVRNFGPGEADNVEVTFTAGSGVPLRAQIASIPPGGKGVVKFTFTFPDAGAVRARVEIPADSLAADNVRYYAARARPGIRVVLVDGDSASAYGLAETFFLERALAPPGAIRSGYAVEVVTEDQFEEMPIKEAQLIFLCNLYRITARRARSLREWVRAGGGLIVLLGDQADVESYNARVSEDGEGLLPLRLTKIVGDEAEEEWTNFAPKNVNHEILRAFAGEQERLLQRVKVFRWWTGKIPPKALRQGRITVIVTYTDAEKSPAIIEKAEGDGRVLLLTTPPDSEWSNWPSDPSYVVLFQEMARYAARSATDRHTLAVGEPLICRLDLSRHKTKARIVPPNEADRDQLQAVPAADGGGMEINYAATGAPGFYRLELESHGGSQERVFYAANIDGEEGDLKPVAAAELRDRLADAKVRFIKKSLSLKEPSAGAKVELWRFILYALLAVLFLEQVAAWFFGTRR